METNLLWASVVVGLVAFLSRFFWLRRAVEDAPPDAVSNTPLRVVAAGLPFAGWLITLPTQGPLFHHGGLLGTGFFIGGIAASVADWPFLHWKRDAAPPALILAGNLGFAAAVAALAQLFLRTSLLDALFGVAIGWFCVAFVQLLALPSAERNGNAGQRYASSAGMAAALCAAAALGTLRDGVTPELAKGTWGGALTAFVTLGALLIAGTTLLPSGGAGKWGKWFPFAVLLCGAGVALYLLAEKFSLSPKLFYAGLAGLIVWPIAEKAVVGGRWSVVGGPIPAAALMLIAAGFMASAQALQGVGASVFVLALWLGYIALTDNRLPSSDVGAGLAPAPTTERGIIPTPNTQHPTPNTLLLPLFATTLLLFRLFVTRWEDQLRGVTLTDSYALFGFLIGAFLPAMLAAWPERWSVVRGPWSVWGIVVLAFTAALTVGAPVGVVLLFGEKAASALLIGLALGGVLGASGEGGRKSLFPALLAVGVGLGMAQFFGRELPPEEWTRLDKLKALGGVVAGMLALLAAVEIVGRRKPEA